MKAGFSPPPPPDDEANDPLLDALRQRLGDYGQAPPPGAWAAIRQRVAPPALPRPWWRRRHLSVLLGLLLLGCLLPGTLGEWPALRRAGQAASASQAQVAVVPDNSPTLATAPGRGGMRRVGQRAADGQAGISSAVSDQVSAPAKTFTGKEILKNQSFNKETYNNASSLPAAASTANLKRQPAPATTVHPGLRPAPDSGAAARPPLSVAAALATSHYPRNRAHGARAGELTAAGPLASPTLLAGRTRQARATMQVASGRTAARDAATETTPRVAVGGRLVARQPAHLLRRAPGSLEVNDSLAASAPAATASSVVALPASSSDILLLGPVGLLALKQPNWVLPAAAAPATLVARPDSNEPAHPARRWALLVVAGPTLSYRTLGPAPVLAAGHPDFARLERPALGLGAQVQVRRVLSGRWALAVGVGYHEYATRLALALADSGYTSIHRRDTYRLLTVPVQASYALGAPRGRFSKALLLGAEPGWYLGGRSTEGSGCGCEQQTYSSASSPYRSLSLAFSLGLDLRYRLGGADSRWQWLVQPTGRYVATPFVRSDAIGFTRRQPFSLGLLTGFSWDVR